MGRLHDRMAEDLTLRNFSPSTRRNYLLYARKFAAIHRRPSVYQAGKNTKSHTLEAPRRE